MTPICNECLPLWRWNMVTGETMSSGGFSFRNMFSSLFQSLTVITWQIIIFIIEIMTTGMEYVVRTGDSLIGFVYRSVPLGVYVVLLLLIFGSAVMGLARKESIARAMSKKVMFLVMGSVVAGIVVPAAGQDAAKGNEIGEVRFSPSWFYSTTFGYLDVLVDVVINTSEREDTASSANTYGSPNCVEYINYLSDVDRINNQKYDGYKPMPQLRKSVSDIWQITHYSTWREMIAGSAGNKIACRLAEARRGTDPSEQKAISDAATTLRLDPSNLDVTANQDSLGTLTIDSPQWQLPSNRNHQIRLLMPWLICKVEGTASTLGNPSQYRGSHPSLFYNTAKADNKSKATLGTNETNRKYVSYFQLGDNDETDDACKVWWRPNSSLTSATDRCTTNTDTNMLVCSDYGGHAENLGTQESIAQGLLDQYVGDTSNALAVFSEGEEDIGDPLDDPSLRSTDITQIHEMWSSTPNPYTENEIIKSITGSPSNVTTRSFLSFMNTLIYGGIVLWSAGMVVLGALLIYLLFAFLPFLFFALALPDEAQKIPRGVIDRARRGFVLVAMGYAMIFGAVWISRNIIDFLLESEGIAAQGYRLLFGVALAGGYWQFRKQGYLRQKATDTWTKTSQKITQIKSRIQHPIGITSQQIKAKLRSAIPNIGDTGIMYDMKAFLMKEGAGTLIDWNSAHIKDWEGVSVAGAGKVTRLSLDGLGLEEIPPQVCKLTDLETFSFKNNNIIQLDSGLGKCKRLETIDVSGCRRLGLGGLSPFSPELDNCGSLVTIQAGNCNFRRDLLAQLPGSLRAKIVL